MKSRILGSMAVLLLAACSAAAQEQRGLIAGTVYDPQGAVVPDAAVTVKDNGTGGVFNGKTTSEGSFTIPGLPFGTYTVTIVAQGFRKWETTHVQVITAQEANVKATLEVGSSADTVTVEVAQEVINTTSSELVTHIDRQQVFDLPSTTRNPLDFATQMAGVTSTGGSATSGSSIMNGLRGSTNNLTQDGIDIRDSFIKTSGFANNSGYNVTLESVGEFSISGQNIGADSGDGVVQVRMVTQRGTNQFHGSLFYFGRNDFLNANSYNNNRLGSPRSRLNQHRFGGAVGGPVAIPKVYNGRNRTFFFFTYSGFREHFQNTDDNEVYSQNARNGIFQYQDANGALQQLNLLTASTRRLGINPFTQKLIGATPVPVAGGSGFTVDPNNGDGLNTLGVRFKVAGADPDNAYDIRIDHKILESHRWGTHWFDGEWHHERQTTTPGNDPPFPPGVAANCFGAVCNSAQTTITKGGLFSMGLNSTMTPTIFNELRLGFNRPDISFLPPVPFPRTFKVDFAALSGENLNPEDNFDPQGRLSPFYTIQDNFTKLKGSHTIKAGFQIIWESTHRFNDFANLSGIQGGVTPQVQLGSNAANDNGLPCSSIPNLPKGGTGTTICSNAQNLYANLTGLVSGITQTYNGVPGQGFVPGLTDALFIKEQSYNYFAQDSWRARPNLTVNLGLRWEIVPPIDIANKRGTIPANGAGDLTPYGTLFQPNAGVTFNSLLANLSSTTQLIPGGTANGNPFWNTKHGNFAPSIGIAWTPMPKIVIRTGYSISYVRDTLTVLSNILSANASLHTGVSKNPVAGDPYSVLDTSVNQVLPPPPLVLPAPQYKNFLQGFSATTASLGVAAFDQNLRNPYVQQWTLGVQRELGKASALEVRYVGNRGIGLYRAQDLDQINLTPALLSEFSTIANNVLNGGTALTPTLAGIGFTSTFPTALNTSTYKNLLTQGQAGKFWFLVQANCTQQFLMKQGCSGLGSYPANFFIANPITGQARLFNNSYGSNYNALQVDFRRALSHGLQFQANYVYGKTLSNSGVTGSQSETDTNLDFHNPRYNYSRAGFDIRHTFHILGTYELPFGRNHQFLSKGIIGKVAEGWQIGGLATWRSGPPITITSAYSTVSQNSTTNPAVAVGMTDAQVCSAIGLYATGGVPFYLPPSFLSLRSTPGTTSGANQAVLANPSAGSLGDQGLRNGCSDRPFYNIDANLVKKIRIREKMSFELRFEAFNVFNHDAFTVGTVTNINSSNFGVARVINTPREAQINARFSF
jgi:hypothetical protein